MLWVLIDDGAVLQVTKVEHPHWAIGTHRGKHVPAPARTAEGNVVNLHKAQPQLHTRGVQRRQGQRISLWHSLSNTWCSLQLVSFYTCQKEEIHVYEIIVSLTETKTYQFPRLGVFYTEK